VPSIDFNNARKAVLRVELVGGTSELRESVMQVLARVTEPTLKIIENDDGEAAGSNGAGDEPIDVAMVLFNGDEDKSLAYLHNHSSQPERPALFGLLKERSPGLMKRVIRAGADELLFLPLEPGDLTRALLEISETRVRAARHDGGSVIFRLPASREARAPVPSRPTSRSRSATNSINALRWSTSICKPARSRCCSMSNPSLPSCRCAGWKRNSTRCSSKLR
jgi:hypothetical protein